MNLTEPSADSARPDEMESQRLHRLAMQDAQQQIAARYGERCRIESRTKESLEARRRERATSEYARQAAFYPQLPRIIVTNPDVAWNDYQTELRGRFGAVVQD
ncbi:MULTISPECIES: hypothetical protein [unclassified Pantoea]|uniref:hypothetical protein n=1 Tax=unclassified Pantoea TaxID=2630326 RepID=UPI001231CA24|nr:MULTISPECIES: hypothetical protein [unclassified Pantoea]KAA5974851.1 hypothetical protein F3I51_02885 [Pantoea sp. M_6]KAA5979206.1 hypothetical protein F3I52_04450 [Pantoea sp. M_8]KAA5992020.1 hypothetical protein F3I47_09165 [Pantoea sp. M_10]